MSIVRVQSASHHGDAVSSIAKAFTSNVTAGNFLVVLLNSYYGDSTIPTPTVTDTLGNTYVQALALRDSDLDATSLGNCHIYFAQSPSGGANTVTFGGLSGAYVVLTILEYSGIDTLAPFDAASGYRYHWTLHGGGADPTSVFTSNAASTFNADDLLIGGLLTYVTTNIATPDSGWSLATYYAGSFQSQTTYERTVSATASYALTGTFSSSQNYCAAYYVAFKAAGSTPSEPPTEITLVNHVKDATSGGGTTSDIDTTDATLLVAFVKNYGGLNFPTVSDSKGNTWHTLTEVLNVGSFKLSTFYAWDHGGSPLSVGSGHNFTIGSSVYGAYVLAFAGTMTTEDPLHVERGKMLNGGTPNQPGTITPSGFGYLYVTAVHLEVSGPSVDSGFSIVDSYSYVGGTSYGGASAWKLNTGTGPLNPSWTWSGGTSGSNTKVVTFRPAPGDTEPTILGATRAAGSVTYPLSVEGGVVFVRRVMATWRRNRQ